VIPLGIGVFLAANGLYLKWRLEDEPDPIRRAVALCMGLPTTFLVFLLVESNPEMVWKRQLRSEARDADPAQIERELERELAFVRRMTPRGQRSPGDRLGSGAPPESEAS